MTGKEKKMNYPEVYLIRIDKRLKHKLKSIGTHTIVYFDIIIFVYTPSKQTRDSPFKTLHFSLKQRICVFSIFSHKKGILFFNTVIQANKGFSFHHKNDQTSDYSFLDR